MAQKITKEQILDVYANTIEGDITNASITGTLPTLNGSNLTNLNAANLTGTLPALDGSNLTGIGGGGGGGGNSGVTAGNGATATTTVNTGIANAKYFAVATYVSSKYLVGTTNASGQFSHTPPASNGNSYSIYWIVVG